MRNALRRRRSEPERPIDPEALRYAPLPPRGSVWRRRIGVLVLALVVLAVAAFGVYKWSQGQYYVGDRSGHVAIYKGVDWSVPGVSMHHYVEGSGLELTALDDFKATQVRQGIQVDSLEAARSKIASLLAQACPTPKPAPTPTSKPTPKSTSKSKTKKKAHASPSPTPTPTVKPGCPGATS